MGSFGFVTTELINGSRPLAPVDKVTYELAEQIEKTFDDFPELEPKEEENSPAENRSSSSSAEQNTSSNSPPERREASLEVEGRLGIVRDSQSGERMKLPVITEAILRPGTIPFNFSAGIRSSAFDDLFERLKQVTGCDGDDNTPSSTSKDVARLSPLQSHWAMLPEQNTFDSFYPISELGKSIRVSYEASTLNTGRPREIIWKQPLLNWSVFTGRDREDDEDMTGGGAVSRGSSSSGSTEMVDYRIAINIERRVDRQYKNIVSQTPEMSRQRRRRTFVHSTGLRLDFTEVEQMQLSGNNRQSSRNSFGIGPHSYERNNTQRSWEVEAELHPKVLHRLVKLKRSGDPGPLYAICAVFLGVLRNWCAFLNNKLDTRVAEDLVLQTYADLRPAVPDQELLDAYLRFVCRRPPLIGDYLFNAVAPQLSKTAARREENMTQEDIQNYRQERLKQMDEATKTSSFSLYTHSTLKLVGPWECVKGPANEPVVQISRSMLRDISEQLH